MGASVGADRRELTGLTGIRALAAAWVVIEHFRLILYALFPQIEPVLGPWIRSGFLGVEVFFILSGFIIAYNYAERFSKFSWVTYRKFIELRFARIYPVQLVTLLALALIVAAATMMHIELSQASNYNAWSFAGNIFNLQALPGVSAWNNPSWSISAEFAAYVAFPVIALGLVHLRRARTAFLAAALLAIVGVGLMLSVAQSIDPSPTGEVMIWLRIAFEFTLGACLFAGWRWLQDRQFGRGWDLVSASALLGLVVTLGFTGGEGSTALITVPIIAVFVLGCAGATGLVGRFLGSRLMLWGGRISYSVYMTHFIILMVLGVVLPPERFGESNMLVRVGILGCYYVTAVLAGAACYYLVEEPARKAIRRAVATRAKTEPSSAGEVDPLTAIR